MYGIDAELAQCVKEGRTLLDGRSRTLPPEWSGAAGVRPLHRRTARGRVNPCPAASASPSVTGSRPPIEISPAIAFTAVRSDTPR